MNTPLRLVFIGVLTLLSACTQDPLTGPPEIRPGRDQCAACGMLISEDRCASAWIVRVRGRAEYALFDDIGCMLDHHPAETEVVQRFVRDHSTRAWLVASAAAYLHEPNIRTPMGSGIVAFSSAQEAGREFPGAGAAVTFDQLVRSRQAAAPATIHP